ncbi:MAG: peptidylprolyl isomerase [Porticoccaceae bacterium]|nr:peptidylprolyl isomerase [Porticoccaceae bacterium]MEA3300305.1 peptidylprolyl isomerase [Pseudomonadota bacterium]HLS98252.1 peptidylprolyl isomerase [Porticoccaceae bacterium]
MVARALATLAALLLSAATLAAGPAPVRVALTTDLGDIHLELYPDKAPRTVENFVGYVNRYFYDGMIFHRVIKGFVIQSGGHGYDLSLKEPGEPIVNESANGLRNRRGTIAMARHTDPDSARAQFFINLADNPSLDPRGDQPGYTVFGKVVEGMGVVDAIGRRRTRALDKFEDLPVEPVQILKARVIPAEASAP